MLKWMFLLGIFSYFQPLYAQNLSEIDSLKSLTSSQIDTIAIDAMNRLGSRYAPHNFDSALYYAKLALFKAREVNHQDRIAESFNQVGVAFDFKGVIDTALFWYNKAFNQYASIPDSSGMADMYLNMGVCYHYGSQNDSALVYYLKAAELKEEISSGKNLGYIFNNMGMLFRMQGNYSRSVEYYKKSLVVKQKEGDTNGTIVTLGNIGTAYQGLMIYDSAEYFMLQGLELAENQTDQSYAYRLYGNLGTSYFHRRNFQKAQEYLSKALDWLNENGEERDILFNEITMGKILVELKSYADAQVHFKKSLEISERLGMLEPIANAHQGLSQTFEGLGDFSQSLHHYKKHDSISNVLYDQTKTSTIEELEQKYQAELRDEEIRRLGVEKKDSINQRNILLLTASVIFLIALLLFMLFRGKIRSNKITKQSLDEKDTLLKEIHHRVKNNLQIISSLLSLQSRFITDTEAKAAVTEGQHRVKSMALIHQKLYQHDNLLGIDIQDYITNLAQSLISSYSMKDSISLTLDVTPLKLDVDTVIPLGLILNEVITNSIKHAFPSGEGTISIEIVKHDTLNVTVKDNGKGFDKESISRDSFGMRMIESLSKKLEATTNFRVDSGTVFSMHISNFKET